VKTRLQIVLNREVQRSLEVIAIGIQYKQNQNTRCCTLEKALAAPHVFAVLRQSVELRQQHSDALRNLMLTESNNAK
jgi:NaMN:DMB phosphoribosyltransferase